MEPIVMLGQTIMIGVFFIIYAAFIILLMVTCFAIIKIPKQLERLIEVLRERENQEQRERHFDH